MADETTTVVAAFAADNVDVSAALVDGEPALSFAYTIGDYQAPAVVLKRSGFTGLADKISAAIQQALAHDGLVP